MERFFRFESSGNERQGAVKKVLRTKSSFVNERLLGHTLAGAERRLMGAARIDGQEVKL